MCVDIETIFLLILPPNQTRTKIYFWQMDLPVTKIQNLGIRLEFKGELRRLVGHSIADRVCSPWFLSLLKQTVERQRHSGKAE